MYSDANAIMSACLREAKPGPSVARALAGLPLPRGRIVPIAVGKAARDMAAAARETTGSRMESGILLTKYGHGCDGVPGFILREAGHPVPDENGLRASQEILTRTQNLGPDDCVLLLLSGGGSALFEKPLIPPQELYDLNRRLLACGASIREINTLRKRLSAVKGGRFAEWVAPARIVTVALSDVLGDEPGDIASGPACPDRSTCEDAARICEKYALELSPKAKLLLRRETPKFLPNASVILCGGVGALCETARRTAEGLGYETFLLTSSLSCEAREAGAFLGAIARSHQNAGRSLCCIAGGETVVHVNGRGRGGRNQELALAAAREIAGCRNTLVFSLASDGTDGPTDAAGGIVDGTTLTSLASAGLDIDRVLADNDAYTALNAVSALIKTGPTGTNVNDVSVVLIKR